MKRLIFIPLLLISLWLNATTRYVATTGNDATGNGAIGTPYATPQYALNLTRAGDSIIVRGGTYYAVNGKDQWAGYDDPYVMGVWDTDGTWDGTALNHIVLMAYPGEVVIFDGSSTTADWTSNACIYLHSCNYWEIIGIRCTGVSSHSWATIPSDAITLYNCSYCTIKQCKCYGNEMGGIQIKGTPNSLQVVTGNLIYQCDAWDNFDNLNTPSGNTADGIRINYCAPESVNTVRACRAWYNSDDGFDFIANKGMVYIDSCWTWLNGRGDGGDGEGFKLGEDLTGWSTEDTIRIVTNCISAYNNDTGFDNDISHGIIVMYNNIAYHNVNYGFLFNNGDNIASIFTNNIASDNRYSGNGYDAIFYSNMVRTTNNWQQSPYETFAPDGTTLMSNSTGIVADEFVSIDSAGISGARAANGNLPVLTFLHLKSTSAYINAGTDVGIAFNSTAPDLGAFEYTVDAPPVTPLVATTGTPTNVNVRRGVGIGTVTYDGGETITARGICLDTSANPDLTKTVFTTTGTTGAFTVAITGLQSSTTYHVRAYATNSEGTSYGSDVEFTTPDFSILIHGTKLLINSSNKPMILK